jgi:hypothetical protein
VQSPQEYPALSKLAVLKLLPFPVTYMREVGFSRNVATKQNISTG